MKKKVIKLTESELKDYIKKIISEQTEQSPYTSPYKVGQVLQGKRSVDGQMYTIKITRVGPAGQKWVVAKIEGPGTYEERPINGKGEYELYSYSPGKISGNDNMGEFTIVKQTNESEQGGKRPHDKMVMDCLTKAGFKSGNTKGKYELYMTKRIKSTAGDVVYIVSSQQDPTTFATNTVINDKVTSRGSFQIGTSTNCNEIVKKSTQD